MHELKNNIIEAITNIKPNTGVLGCVQKRVNINGMSTTPQLAATLKCCGSH
jgi:hypothetical protein